jgi:hypothetical protein
MKNLFLWGVFLIGFCTNGYPAEKLNDIIYFASVEKSKQLLTKEDDYTDRWSQLDIDIRMQKANSNKEELLQYIPTQVRAWNENEKNLIRSILSGFDQEIAKQGYHIPFPDTIFFIKTTFDEEIKGTKGLAGYTRSNYVVLNGDIYTQSDSLTRLVVIHEIFHVLSRHNPELRAKLYKIIGFEQTNEIQFYGELAYHKLTNPDAPYFNSFIKLTHEGLPVECMMIIYSDRKYTGGNIMDYANIGLLKISGTDVKKIDEQAGKPIIYKIENVTGFFEQVGRNTDYIIDPEEIIADNFAFTLLGAKGLPNPEIIDNIIKLLRE